MRCRLDKFVELAKQSKDKPLTSGTVGIDSLYHLMGEVDFAILAYQASMDGLQQADAIFEQSLARVTQRVRALGR